MNKLLSIAIACLFLGLFSCNDTEDQFLGPEEILVNNIQDIEAFLDANNLVAERTANDLFYIVNEPGNGVDFPTVADEVEVHYHGYFLNGQVFDSSIDRGVPANFPLANVIPGWQLGIPLFSKGSKGMLIIPSHLAYGPAGIPGIPGGAVLVFDIELLGVN